MLMPIYIMSLEAARFSVLLLPVLWNQDSVPRLVQVGIRTMNPHQRQQASALV